MIYFRDEKGTITVRGLPDITKGNHNGMPPRTDAYLSTDQRGHIQASSLNGPNDPINIIPMSKELNYGAYYNMEAGERNALKNGCTIETEKIAYVSNQPGNRPDAFMVNDQITYPDGNVQNVHLSFTNLTNEEQDGMDKIEQEYFDVYDHYDNPGDTLRSEFTPQEYAQLMDETDPYLSNVSDYYAAHTEISFDNNDGNTVDDMGVDDVDVSLSCDDDLN